MTALGALGLLIATHAAAQGQPPADTPADLLKKPTTKEIESHYPNAALAKAATGSARIRCTATVDATLRNCSVVSESPAGLGFGDATVAMAPLFRMNPATKAGLPVDSEVLIPLAFSMPSSMITNPEWLKKPSEEEVLEFWPLAAMKAKIGGTATLRCKVTVDGLVNHCLVIAESPKDLGVGASALSMANLFRMKPLVRDGVPVGGAEMIIPVSFTCDGGCNFPSNFLTSVKLYRIVPWLQAPTSAQVAEAYPAKARKDQMQSGLIALQCTVSGAGLLDECETSAENPRGEGLAAAARTLSHDFKAPLKDSQGNSMRGSKVLLNFAFAPRMLDDPALALGTPTMVETLSTTQMEAAFPAKAKAAGIGFGEVKATCVVGDEGHLTECKIQNEAPAGMDFAPAAQQILAGTRASLWSENGLPTLGAPVTLRLPIGVEKPGEESANTLRTAVQDALVDQDADKALGLVKTLLSKFPPDQTAANLLSGIEVDYAQQGHFDKAIDTIDVILAYYPRNSGFFRLRCWIKATKNIQPQSALADCDQALKLSPKNAHILFTRGEVRLKAGDNAAAIDDFQAALDNGPDDAEILFGRGVAKNRIGDTAGGKTDIAAAKKLDSNIAKAFASFGVTP
jgi:TonB family protein